MSVGVERRSGVDRRSGPRLALNSKIKQDVYETKNFLLNSPKIDVFQRSSDNKQLSFESAVLKEAANKINKPAFFDFMRVKMTTMAIPTLDITDLLNIKNKINAKSKGKEAVKTIVTSTCRMSGCGLAIAATYLAFPVTMTSLVPLTVAALTCGAIGACVGDNVANKINTSIK